MNYELTYKSYGERSILIQWPGKIEENILQDLLFFKKLIEKKCSKVIIEVISSYNSLLIIYVSTIEDFYIEISALKKHYKRLKYAEKQKKVLWEIPVCYDVELAPDLESYSIQKAMTISEIIRLHTKQIYTVYFIGFLPGFLYLGGLDSSLFLPRKATPVLKVPKGAVAIGGEQTGIYPQDSPGGWHVIGKSPMSFFEANVHVPCFVTPGDRVQFVAIDFGEYNAISSLVVQGVFMPKSKIYAG